MSYATETILQAIKGALRRPSDKSGFGQPYTEYAKFIRDEYDRLKMENERLLRDNTFMADLLKKIGDAESDRCRFDHHGACQEHWLEEDCSINAIHQFFNQHTGGE